MADRSAAEGAHKGRLWTIGHSTRAIDDFIALLMENSIEVVGDVRRYPGSRRFPQYNPEALADSLRSAGIAYQPFPSLGGRRTPRSDSPYTVWRNDSFRGYADYMDTGAFREGLESLMELAETRRVAILCSEAVWWRCHRSMIADALKTRGYLVHHIMGPGKVTEHPFTAPARASGGLPYARDDLESPA